MVILLGFAAAFGFLFMIVLYLLLAVPVVLAVLSIVPSGGYRTVVKWLIVTGLIVSSPWVVGTWMYGPSCESYGVPVTARVTAVNGEPCGDCTIEFRTKCRATVRTGEKVLGTLRWTQHTDPESPGHYYKIERGTAMQEFPFPPGTMTVWLPE